MRLRTCGPGRLGTGGPLVPGPAGPHGTGAVLRRRVVALVLSLSTATTVLAGLPAGGRAAEPDPGGGGAAAPSGRTERVSLASDGAEAEWGAEDYSTPAITPDGRYVVFWSWSTNLVPDDTNDEADMFVRDRLAGTTERVSVASDGTEADRSTARLMWGTGKAGDIPPDGRYVVFDSEAMNLSPLDTNTKCGYSSCWSRVDVYLHDRETDTTELVSVAETGESGNSYSFDHSISADGRYVAFSSNATDMAGSDPNGTKMDVFVRDRVAGLTERVYSGTDDSYWPDISADGRYLAFVSGRASQNVYFHDRETAETTLVGTNSAGNAPEISADGRRVAFDSSDSLVPEDTAQQCYPWGCSPIDDTYVWDRDTGALHWASRASDGTAGNADSEGPAISPDGRYVAFGSWADNLVPGDTNGPDAHWNRADIFVHDTETGTTERVSLAADGSQATQGAFWKPAVTEGAREVAFSSTAEDLVAGDTNGGEDAFVARRADNTFATVVGGGVPAGSVERQHPGDWGGGDTHGRFQVALRHQATAPTPGAGRAWPPVFDDAAEGTSGVATYELLGASRQWRVVENAWETAEFAPGTGGGGGDPVGGTATLGGACDVYSMPRAAPVAVAPLLDRRRGLCAWTFEEDATGGYVSLHVSRPGGSVLLDVVRSPVLPRDGSGLHVNVYPGGRPDAASAVTEATWDLLGAPTADWLRANSPAALSARTSEMEAGLRSGLVEAIKSALPGLVDQLATVINRDLAQKVRELLDAVYGWWSGLAKSGNFAERILAAYVGPIILDYSENVVLPFTNRLGAWPQSLRDRIAGLAPDASFAELAGEATAVLYGEDTDGDGRTDTFGLDTVKEFVADNHTFLSGLLDRPDVAVLGWLPTSLLDLFPDVRRYVEIASGLVTGMCKEAPNPGWYRDYGTFGSLLDAAADKVAPCLVSLIDDADRLVNDTVLGTALSLAGAGGRVLAAGVGAVAGLLKGLAPGLAGGLPGLPLGGFGALADALEGWVGDLVAVIVSYPGAVGANTVRESLAYLGGRVDADVAGAFAGLRTIIDTNYLALYSDLLGFFEGAAPGLVSGPADWIFVIVAALAGSGTGLRGVVPGLTDSEIARKVAELTAGGTPLDLGAITDVIPDVVPWVAWPHVVDLAARTPLFGAPPPYIDEDGGYGMAVAAGRSSGDLGLVLDVNKRGAAGAAPTVEANGLAWYPASGPRMAVATNGPQSVSFTSAAGTIEEMDGAGRSMFMTGACYVYRFELGGLVRVADGGVRQCDWTLDGPGRGVALQYSGAGVGGAGNDLGGQVPDGAGVVAVADMYAPFPAGVDLAGVLRSLPAVMTEEQWAGFQAGVLELPSDLQGVLGRLTGGLGGALTSYGTDLQAWVPAFQGGLDSFLAGLRGRLDTAGADLGAIAEDVGAGRTEFLPGLRQLLDRLLTLVGDIQGDTRGWLGQAGGQVRGLLGRTSALVDELDGVLAAGIDGAAGEVQSLLVELGRLLGLLQGQIQGMLAGVGDVLRSVLGVGSGFLDWATATLGAGLDALDEVVARFTGDLTSALQSLKAAMPPLLQAAFGPVLDLVTLLGGTVRAVVGAVVGGVRGLLAGLVTGIKTLIAGVQGIVTAAQLLVQAAVVPLFGLLAGVLALADVALGAVWGLARSLLGAVTTFLRGLLAAAGVGLGSLLVFLDGLVVGAAGTLQGVLGAGRAVVELLDRLADWWHDHVGSAGVATEAGTLALPAGPEPLPGASPQRVLLAGTSTLADSAVQQATATLWLSGSVTAPGNITGWASVGYRRDGARHTVTATGPAHLIATRGAVEFDAVCNDTAFGVAGPGPAPCHWSVRRGPDGAMAVSLTTGAPVLSGARVLEPWRLAARLPG